MKDFLTAWQAGEKINASRDDRDYRRAQKAALEAKTARENDPERLKLEDDTARANLQRIRTSTGATAASTGLTGVNTQVAQERLRGLRQQNDLLNPNSPNYIYKPQGSGLLPPGGALPVPTMPGTEAPTVVPSIPAYQEGGLVEDDEPVLAADDDEGAGALPTDISAQSRYPRGSYGGVVSQQLINDATKAGLQFGHQAFGFRDPSQLRTAQGRARALQYMQGAGGLTPQEMEAAGKSVDPEGKLSESQRNIAALGSVYQYQLNKGNPEGAQRVAFQMLQHYRAASQRYAAIAAAAANSGNMDMAAKAAARAYANIPDGKDFNVVKQPDGSLAYTFTDTSSGKVLQKGIATPQQLVGAAMGLAQGGFDRALMQAAGATEATTKGGGGKQPTTADRKNLLEIAGKPIEDAQTAWESNEKNKGKVAPNWGQMRDVTTHLLQDNPKATPREAFNIANKLYMLSESEPDKPGFKVTPIEGDDGMSMVQVGGGPKLRVSNETIEAAIQARAEAIKSAKTKKEEDAKDPGWMSKFGAVGDALANAATGYVDRVKMLNRMYHDQQAREQARKDASQRIASPPPGDVESQRYSGVLPPF